MNGARHMRSAPAPAENLRARLLAGTALAVVLAVVLGLILRGGPSYLVHAHFADAGQLVPGDSVDVGGLPVGSISHIGVTPDGQADIVLRITDARFVPLRQGTLATIRAAGAAGIANRYVGIEPGPSGAPAISDGGVLPETATRGIVDLDMLLDAFDRPTRERLKSIIGNSAVAFGSPAAARQAFALLNPALSQASLLGAELVRDRSALNGLVASTATTLHALDSNRPALDRAVTSLAEVLRTVAAHRSQLADILARTGDVLHRLRTTFGGLRATLPVVGTMLAQARPAVAPLVRLLRRVVPDTALVRPALATLAQQLPATARAVNGIPALARVAIPALSAARKAIIGVTPIVTGLRPYTLDWMAGAITLIGMQYAYYDQLGHYARETILGGQESLAGILSLLPPINAPVPGAPSFRTGLLARCPGAAAEPAPDRSNPWVPNPKICNPQDNHR